MTMESRRAQEILDGFTGKNVLVIGDVMLDEYIWGRVSRVSPEAPVLVIDADHHTFVPGGAANVVNNLCALGAQAAITGLVGPDSAGATLREKLAEEGAKIDGLVTVQGRPTTQKTRVIAHTQQGAQQVVRIDHERRDPLDQTAQAHILSYLEAAIPNSDAVLLSDYQKGLLGRAVIKMACDLAYKQKKIITGNIKPEGINGDCRMTIITLNVFEASQASGFMLGEGGDESLGTLREAGRVLLRKTNAENILITRGAHGLTLFSTDGSVTHLPAHPVEVFDGTGAGDTVISTLTLALTAGAAPIEAVTLANSAGAVVVKKVGVATASRSEILATFTAESEDLS